MATFGETGIGGTRVWLNGDVLNGCKFQMGALDGILSSMSLYCDTVAMGASGVKCGIFDDDGADLADVLQGEDAVGEVLGAGQAASWVTRPVVCALTANQLYWLFWKFGAAGGFAFYAAADRTSWKANPYADPFLNPYGAEGGSNVNRRFSIYATYTPTAVGKRKRCTSLLMGL